MANDTSSQDHIWDDSALLSTWDEAVAEYKKYHSLAARGETIPISTSEEEKASTPAHPSKAQQKQPLPNGSLNAAQPSSGAEEKLELQSSADASATAHTTLPGAAAVPQALMNSVQDEGLKNLMMSWYYAGYYTGLYEGKQTAYANMQGNG